MTMDVSVVVPTYNRCDLLDELLEALLRQRGVRHEIIIVDDGSDDETPSLLQGYEHREQVRVLRTDNGGPARARNLGWRAATSPLVAFTDDDCIPADGWLAGLVGAAAGLDIVQGRTNADGTRGWWDRTLRVQEFSGRFETCNLLVRRDLLERLDGFDERFPVAWGEDADLGLRALRTGASTGFAEDAVVVHRVFPRTYGEFLADRWRFTQTVALVRYNPDARRLLTWRVAFSRSHLAVWGLLALMAVGVALGAWWAVPAGVLAALAWFARPRSDSSGRPWASRALRAPAWFLAAVWETLCFAVASIRHRTIVL